MINIYILQVTDAVLLQILVQAAYMYTFNYFIWQMKRDTLNITGTSVLLCVCYVFPVDNVYRFDGVCGFGFKALAGS